MEIALYAVVGIASVVLLAAWWRFARPVIRNPSAFLSKPTCAAPPVPECKPPRVEQAQRIQVLSMAAGDTLIIEHASMLTVDQCKSIKAQALNSIPDGCKVMVLHGGLKVAGTISARDPIEQSIARLDAHNLE